jgi:hypothetical protein
LIEVGLGEKREKTKSQTADKHPYQITFMSKRIAVGLHVSILFAQDFNVDIVASILSLLVTSLLMLLLLR